MGAAAKAKPAAGKAVAAAVAAKLDSKVAKDDPSAPPAPAEPTGAEAEAAEAALSSESELHQLAKKSAQAHAKVVDNRETPDALSEPTASAKAKGPRNAVKEGKAAPK